MAKIDYLWSEDEKKWKGQIPYGHKRKTPPNEEILKFECIYNSNVYQLGNYICKGKLYTLKPCCTACRKPVDLLFYKDAWLCIDCIK